ncbi:hypothetical protein SDC9_202749 [bioreactor metagenome]|uniref:Uncharacterized protein n=1 Tax=bioreactor metagenome TaxID=1076179 RepID=A0A645IW13_9ZZZZ
MSASSSNSTSGISINAFCSLAKSDFSISPWELTDTYSPAAIDIAPAIAPAKAAKTMGVRDALAAATPIIILEVDNIPSFAPKTAALNQLDLVT